MKEAFKLFTLAFIVTLGLSTVLPEAYMEIYMLFITHYGLLDSLKRNPQMVEVIKPLF